MNNKIFSLSLLFGVFVVFESPLAENVEGCGQIYDIQTTISSCTAMIEDPKELKGVAVTVY